MAYPERKPIYEAYKAIIKPIIDSNPYKSFAENEIDELDKSLFDTLKEIRAIMMLNKDWPADES
jgi:NifB/MoaA-like Fe-S oxidoreductase